MQAQALRAIFDPELCDCIWDPKISVMGRAHVSNSKTILSVIVPLYASNQNMKMTVEDWRDAAQSAEVPWDVGSIVLVPGKADMKISGCNSGYMVFLGIGYGNVQAWRKAVAAGRRDLYQGQPKILKWV